MISFQKKMTVTIYDAFGNKIGTKSKKECHQEYARAAKAREPQPFKHEHIGALLIDLDGNLLLQHHDPEASANAGMYDKTLGSHVLSNQRGSAALLGIANREFEIPIAEVTQRELLNIVLKHPDLVAQQAFAYSVDFNPDFVSERALADGTTLQERCMQEFLIGVYDGRGKSRSEGTTIGPFGLEKIKRIAERDPRSITGDLRSILRDYCVDVQRVLETTKHLKALEGIEKPAELVDELHRDDLFHQLIERKKAHQVIKEAYFQGKPQQVKHEHIGGMLVGKNGEVYVQIKAKEKAENPGAYDKIVGGHIPSGDSPVVAAYHEFLEEMEIPVILYDSLQWENVLRTFPESPSYQAICRRPELDRDFVSVRFRPKGDSFLEICNQYWVFGYYHERFRFGDQEAAGIFQFPNREELAREMLTDPLHQYMVSQGWHSNGDREGKPNLVFPDPQKVLEAMKHCEAKFTPDFRYMVDKYWTEMISVEKRFS
ncbi:hypothetical protein COY27_00080 [Candidatus Woesearchaeota archaeon CG_4_10_14_0_2_um_filter_33_13]|nr:MAG: hypothetical protein COY27_00080 [Candidatus Woesearchaeota archaeon CG_4_10_14_0_2_um_filter_33_13]